MKMIFIFVVSTYFFLGYAFILIFLMFLAKIFAFDHELGYVVSLLIIVLLVELFRQF